MQPLKGRWRPVTYDELLAREKVSLDIFCLRDETRDENANRRDQDVLPRTLWRISRRLGGRSGDSGSPRSGGRYRDLIPTILGTDEEIHQCQSG